MAEPADSLDEAAALGRLEAAAFEAGLRAAERRERDDRLTRLAAGADEDGSAPAASAAAHPDVQRLQSEVERLAAFHAAVVRSRGWRLLQSLRRPFGRAW